MTDTDTTFALLRRRLQQFVLDRDWAGYHTPKNLAMSIAIEAAELMEHFQWSTPEGSQRLAADPAERARVADELADVVIYCLHFANRMDIDVSSAVEAKLARNEQRFPAGYVPPSADGARDAR
jgi:NTP pyrophosphatase (non-canonical NTP hydrolase)